ncbi:MAG: hypothetical protein Ct9H300mP11_21930 [Chloroflexota bacterium]|nr:MAG: hypothetical protein Ct9H300mP11_21930 [Chloroflexota bacterium]
MNLSTIDTSSKGFPPLGYVSVKPMPNLPGGRVELSRLFGGRVSSVPGVHADIREVDCFCEGLRYAVDQEVTVASVQF